MFDKEVFYVRKLPHFIHTFTEFCVCVNSDKNQDICEFKINSLSYKEIFIISKSRKKNEATTQRKALIKILNYGEATNE